MKTKKPNKASGKRYNLGKLVIIGTAGHAKVVYDVYNLALQDKFNFVGFITSDNITLPEIKSK